MISRPFGVQAEPKTVTLQGSQTSRLPFGLQVFGQVEQVNVRASRNRSERLNATVRPSGETAGEKSGDDFVGGEVKLRVSPLSVDNSAKPSVTTHLPSGSQANKGLGARYILEQEPLPRCAPGRRWRE